MGIQIERPDTFRRVKSLIFAPPGAGKTVLLGTANDDVRTYPMLLLDYEGGTSSLIGREIDIVKIRSWRDFDEVYDFLLRGTHGYKSVGIDSMSETHIFALLAQLSIRERKIADLLEQGDYGIVLNQMRKLLRKFRNLPFHIFATSLDKNEMDPKEGMVKKPALSGGLSDEAPGIFESVSYLQTEVLDDGYLHRILILQNYPKLRVKIRMPQGYTAPNEIVDPTITAILDTLMIPYEGQSMDTEPESTPETPATE